MSLEAEVIAAARVLAANDLVDAFGHVSARLGPTRAIITPARPLSSPDLAESMVHVDVNADELPHGTPGEAWIHLEVYRARPDVGGICRAQPQSVAGVSAGRLQLFAMHGHGAFVGSPVAVYDDAILVRDRLRGRAVASALGAGDAVVLRGNGAVTVGSSPGEAAARMCVLEQSARLNLAAAVGPGATPLTAEEMAEWRSVAPEILGRLWDYLRDRA